ncbi:hypothetical protein [Anaplasma capra]|uniref:hypothetical protein n=1 Tax=Anaplasma capra TaxID=1562740 RepID=UPI0021D5C5FB|nr:hypothetical protein [Anaplasma capra]MCU7611636.1 hypothetical protein [Anaplasma capra]MCU7612216.1 hypothetical protein [Anaplasma capra]
MNKHLDSSSVFYSLTFLSRVLLMKPYISRYTRLFCFAALITAALPGTSALAMETIEKPTTADLGIRLGMYHEGDRLPLRSKSSDETLPNTKNYSALAGVRYVVTTKKVGNLSAEIGYVYRSEQLLQSYSFVEMKKRIESSASLYAEARWGTKGLLLVPNLEFSLGANVGGEKVEQGTVPVRFMGGFTYKVGGITSVYTGLQYVMHMNVKSPVSPSLVNGKGISRYVVGVEFAI